MEKKCKRCGVIFHTPTKIKLYCSTSCRKLRYEEANRIYRRRNQRIYIKDRERRKELGNECWFCLSKKDLQMHHITYSDSSEIVLVCRKCHAKLHICLKNR